VCVRVKRLVGHALRVAAKGAVGRDAEDRCQRWRDAGRVESHTSWCCVYVPQDWRLHVEQAV
jgi:hypothetical protein